MDMRTNECPDQDWVKCIILSILAIFFSVLGQSPHGDFAETHYDTGHESTEVILRFGLNKNIELLSSHPAKREVLCKSRQSRNL